MELEFKKCLECEETKVLSEFRKSKKYYNSYCIPCERKRGRENQQRNRVANKTVVIDWTEAKKCRVCLEIKTKGDFQLDRTTKDSLKGICKICCAEEQKFFHIANPVARRRVMKKANIKANFGVTLDDKEDLINFQGRCCAVCGGNTPSKNLKRGWALDHNHETGEIRGVLCYNCNVGLGMAKDSEDILLKMIAYLKDFPAPKFFGEKRYTPRNRY